MLFDPASQNREIPDCPVRRDFQAVNDNIYTYGVIMCRFTAAADEPPALPLATTHRTR